MQQSRNWCFTDFEILDFTTIYNDNQDIIRYMTYGTEIAPKTKKKHLQGWIQFKNKKRLGGVKKLIGSDKIHLEACRGSEAQNSKYCQKDGDYKEYGKFIIQGQRTDLEMIQKKLANGASVGEIIEDNFVTYCKHRKGIIDGAQHYAQKRAKAWRDLKVEYIYGETGTGKTKYAMQDYASGNVYKINGSSMDWWDGYQGEKTLVIDEYSNDVKITQMLNILDGYPLRLPTKGSFTYANWEKVIITSNINPLDLHQNAKEYHHRALMRRINNIVQMC